MARERPPLQLQFTVQGTKRVLPITTENVARVFKTGVLTKRGFWMYVGIPYEHVNDPLCAATWWVEQGTDRRWRFIVFCLDQAGETGLADELMPYAEPPPDPSLTVARVILILMELKEWNNAAWFNCGGYILVPGTRSDIIRRQHTSIDDQKKEAATYYGTTSPFASWGHLATCVYQSEEKRVVEAFKVQVPKPKDPTLTVENMVVQTDGVEMPKSQLFAYHCLDMPRNTYNEILRKNGTGKNGRKALFIEFLSHHPFPTWEVLIKLLDVLENMGKARVGLAQDVKEKYLTGVHFLFNLCVGHIVNHFKLYHLLLQRSLPQTIHAHICSLPSWQQQETSSDML